jgi:hypothetical protein
VEAELNDSDGMESGRAILEDGWVIDDDGDRRNIYTCWGRDVLDSLCCEVVRERERGGGVGGRDSEDKFLNKDVDHELLLA